MPFKPLLSGLVLRGGVPSKDLVKSGIIGGAVANIDWAQVEPSPGQYDRKPVDDALAAIVASGLPGARLRLFCGTHAPDDLRSMPFTGRQNTGEVKTTTPEFWRPAVMARGMALLVWLAQQFDDDPRLLDVCYSYPTTYFAEWPFRQFTVADNAEQYRAHDYSEAADRGAIETFVYAHDLFRSTRTYFANSNAKQVLTDAGKQTTDLDYTVAVMTLARKVLGRRAVHGANNLDVSMLPGKLYQAIAAQGAPLSFQTQIADKINPGDLAKAIQGAYKIGASAIELPGGYDKLMDAKALGAANEQLRAAAATVDSLDA